MSPLVCEFKKHYYIVGEKSSIRKKREVFTGSGVNSTINDFEKEELRQLRKENRELKLERNILKKAVGIFSKND